MINGKFKKPWFLLAILIVLFTTFSSQVKAQYTINFNNSGSFSPSPHYVSGTLLITPPFQVTESTSGKVFSFSLAGNTDEGSQKNCFTYTTSEGNSGSPCLEISGELNNPASNVLTIQTQDLSCFKLDGFWIKDLAPSLGGTNLAPLTIEAYRGSTKTATCIISNEDSLNGYLTLSDTGFYYINKVVLSVSSDNMDGFYMSLDDFTFENPLVPKQASNVTFSNINSTGAKIQCNKGTQALRAIFVKEGTGTFVQPTNGNSIVASTAFGLGTPIGSSGYNCVYAGADSAVVITGLIGNEQYTVEAVEFSGTIINPTYFPGGATQNPNSFTTSYPNVATVTLPLNKIYKPGESLYFTLGFNETMTVTGSPYLTITLDTGGAVQAQYVSGSGSANLVFRYTLVSGQEDYNGITLSNTISLNGGSIKNSANADANTTFTGIGSTAGILVDGIGPYITSLTGPVAGNCVTGNTVHFYANYNENVTVPGNLYMKLQIGKNTKLIPANGFTNKAIDFAYTVASDDYTQDSVYVKGGTITTGVAATDLQGNKADSTFSAFLFSGVTVNTILPSVSVQAASGITTSGAVANFTVTDTGKPKYTSLGVCLSSYKTNPTITDTLVNYSGDLSLGAKTLSITGLIPGRKYYLRAFITSSIGTNYSDVINFTAASTVPTKPTNVTATPGNQNAVIAFTASENNGSTITGYKVTSYPGGITAEGSNSPITITGLTNGTAYRFTVHAINGNGNSPESDTTTAVTPATVPSVPSIAFVHSVADGSAYVYYNYSAGSGGSRINSYTVTLSPGAITVTDTVNPIAVQNLTPGASYSAVIKANNAIGSSGWSTPAYNWVFPVSAVITTDSVAGITTQGATVYCNLASLGLPAPTLHGVAYGTNVNISDSSTTTGATSGVFSFNLSGLEPGTKYYVRGFVKNDSLGYINGNMISFTTVALKPVVQARKIRVSSNSAGQAVLSWQKGGGAKRAVFLFEGRDTVAYPTDSITYTASANWASKGSQIGTSNSFCVYSDTGNAVTVSGLRSGILYSVRVFEYNGPAGGERYLTVSDTGNPCGKYTVPKAPDTLYTTNITSSGFKLCWDTASGAQSYLVCISTDAHGANILRDYDSVSADSHLFYNITGLNGNTTYYCFVHSVDSGGVGDRSLPLAVTTKPAVQPVDTNVTSTGFTAVWASVTGSENYLLDYTEGSSFIDASAPADNNNNKDRKNMNVSKNGGGNTVNSNYNTINVGNSLSYTFTNLNPATTYTYRVRALDTAGVVISVSTPQSVSTSAPVVNNGKYSITSPSANTKWKAGTYNYIEWKRTGGAVYGSILLEYSTDNGATWNKINNQPIAGICRYSWLTPSVNSANCLVRLSNYATRKVYDVTANPFELYIADVITSNYPNPFNPATKIRFSLQKGGFVSLRVYNSIGQEVKVLNNGPLEAGAHEYEFDATTLPSGVYFYNILFNGHNETRKMLLLK